MKIQIEHKALRAALVCAAKKDVRSYLVGVYVEFNSPTHALCVGTNGAMMGAFAAEYSCDDPADAPTLGASILIPAETIKSMKPGRFTTHAELTLASDGSCGTLHDRMFRPLEGRFPDFRRVMPAASTVNHETQTPGQFDPEWLVRGRDSLRTFTGKSKKIFDFIQRGEDSGVMHDGGDEAHVIILPMRMTNPKFLGIASDTWDRPAIKLVQVAA